MISVGLPIFNQVEILPVALESLCHQKNAGQWELIICSEDDITKIIDPYTYRLHDNGCVRIKLDILNEWTPLPLKWKRIGELMLPDSIGMMLQAADCYGHENRIAFSRAAMLLGFDWYHERKGYFFDITSFTLAEYCKKENHTFLNMCMASAHARKIPHSIIKSSVDFFLLSSIKNPKIYTHEENLGGVDFNGLQNISNNRGAMISSYQYPFFKTNKRITDIIPHEILSIALNAKKN
jgi:glycosyltransferase involved in cell wall biosynthesis